MFYPNSGAHGLMRMLSLSFRLFLWPRSNISAVTLAEIRFGIDLIGDPGRRRALDDWLTLKIRPMFDQRVLQVTEEVLLRWRLLIEKGRKSGHAFSQPDALIAATAIQYSLTVVTRDRADYDAAGMAVIDPWHTP